MEEQAPRQPTLYLETSVISYLTARPSRDILILTRQQLTRLWWEEKRHEYRLFASPAVVEEAEDGNAAAAEDRLRILAQITLLPPEHRIEALAGTVWRALHMPEKAVADALHIAFAIHYRLDYLLTWNCAHLANAQNLRRLADLCRSKGLWLPIICTPEEMVEWAEEA